MPVFATMTALQDDLVRFQQFAAQKLESGSASSLEQLFDLWLLEHPSDEQAAADLASIEQGISDADAGRVTPVGESFEEVRKALGSKP